MTRLEKDSLGYVEVPKEAYYGAQTVRALSNFPITLKPIHPMMIKALGMIKLAATSSNHKVGFIDKKRFHFIQVACQEVIDGQLNHHFITDAIQGGAGTSAHMNVNEVIANRANELAHFPLGSYEYIHPNDHLNFGQSTNDVYPSAGRLASLFLVLIY